MSKYFDRLVEINESLTRELNPGEKGTPLTTTNDEKPAKVIQESDKDEITIPKDSLDADQKKDILTDKGVDKEVVDNMKDAKELDAALDATLNNDEVKNESEEDIDESVILRMDDAALDIHGYVKKFENGEIEWTNDEQEAERFQHEELGQNKIEAICARFHYDPETFTIKSVDPRADEPYVESVGIDEATDDGVSDMVYVRIDDDDLEKHGYLSRIPNENEEPEWVDDEKDAVKVSRDSLQDLIKSLSQVHHYDPETISVQDCDSQVSDNGENWVTIDPTTPSATTLP